MPESLIVTGIRMLAEYGYIRGGFGHVFNNVQLCCTLLISISQRHWLIEVHAGLLQRSIGVAVPPS